MSSPLPELAIIDRTRERAERVMRNNSSNTAKALARDALELCELVDDFRHELAAHRGSTVARSLSALASKIGVRL